MRRRQSVRVYTNANAHLELKRVLEKEFLRCVLSSRRKQRYDRLDAKEMQIITLSFLRYSMNLLFGAFFYRPTRHATSLWWLQKVVGFVVS
jgi:hypothetical protein